MSDRLKGKRAFITAGAAGIGRACALAFTREGATVIATDVDEIGLASLKKEGIAEVHKLDVRDTAAVEAMARKTGKIDILLNAAALALAATATVVPQGGQPFSPYIYGQVAVEVLPKGSVTKMKAEGRLDPGDPWEEDALVLELNEIIDISTEPTVAVATAIEEDDISIGIGDDFNYTINGGAPQSYVFVAATTSSATAAAAINAAASEPVVIGSIDGRVVIRTVLKGSAASIQIDAGVASSYLFAGEPLFTGSDGDVEIVIL